MATQLSRNIAAQAWCKPATAHKTMDWELAEAFAEIIDEITSQTHSDCQAAEGDMVSPTKE